MPRSDGKFRAALRVRDLRLLMIAFIVDGGATWSYNVVLIAYVFERTHSASWVTTLVTVRWLVGIVLGGYAGVLADRYDRRSVLLTSAVAAFVATLIVATLVQTDAPLIAVLASAAALGAVCTPVRPASGALIPEVVDESELIAANSMFSILEGVIVVIGPGVGGLTLLAGKPVYGILINAASYLVAIMLYLRLGVRSRGDAERGGSVLKQWGAGLSALAHERTALVLTVFLVVDSAAMNAAIVLLPALSDHLGGGSSGFAVLLAVNSLGTALAAGLANRLAAGRRVTAVITLSMIIECVPLWVSVFVGHIATALPLQVLSGAGMVIVDVLAFTSLQRDLPRAVLGRVLGSVDALLLAANIGAAFAASALLSHFGLAWAMALLGLGLPALSLLGLPALRGLDAQTAERVTRLAASTGVLRRLDLFAGASPAVLEQLAEHAERLTLPAGTTIITQGDAADAFWVLTEGELAVSATLADGTSKQLPTVDAPGYVGELGLMHHRERSATVVTASQCRLLKISGEEFQQALEQSAPSPTLLGQAGVRLARTSVSPVPATTGAPA